MPGRVLLITNDFPPRQGGIESYLRDFCNCVNPDQLSVLASTRVPGQDTTDYDASLPYTVHRLRDRILLPLPHVARAAARIVEAEDIDTVWFGAAAPLALLAPALRRRGVARIVSTTHGHEVGWSMIPGGRAALRIIGRNSDVITYISRYTRGRLAAVFGPNTALERLPSGVDIQRFSPDKEAGLAIRQRHGLDEDTPLIVCISRLVRRKGQDKLIQAMPAILRSVPDAHLMVVGSGGRHKALEQLTRDKGVTDNVIFTGAVPYEELPAHYNAASVFAMPARTRGAGLDVEGLGIVYLEAQSCAVPVIAGTSGGAPETVIDGETGYVVDGRSPRAIADATIEILRNPQRACEMGQAGRRHVTEKWTWNVMGAQLRHVLGVS